MFLVNETPSRFTLVHERGSTLFVRSYTHGLQFEPDEPEYIEEFGMMVEAIFLWSDTKGHGLSVYGHDLSDALKGEESFYSCMCRLNGPVVTVVRNRAREW